jgi:hypothetical protein
MFWLQMALTFGLLVITGYVAFRRLPILPDSWQLLASVGALIGSVLPLFGTLTICYQQKWLGKSTSEPIPILAWLLVTASAVILIGLQTFAMQQLGIYTKRRALEAIADQKRHNSVDP